MATPDPLTYSALSTKPEIRLLRIHQARHDGDQIIRCSFDRILDLSDGAIDAAPIPQYIAVSYAWGDSGRDKPIWIDGQSLLVRHNCWDAIRTLRDNYLPQSDLPLDCLVWIDAVCINQFDHSEKNLQVPLMRQIYALAHITVAMLGPGKDILNLRRLGLDGPRDWTCFEMRKIISALQWILKKPYFERLWVVQEILLAKHLVLVQGQASIPRNHFVGFVDAFKNQLGRSSIAHVQELTKHRAVLARPPDVPDAVELFRSYGRLKCSNPRDSVYALIGVLARSLKWRPYKVDYDCTPFEVLQYFVRRLCYVNARSYDSGALLRTFPIAALMCDLLQISREAKDARVLLDQYKRYRSAPLAEKHIASRRLASCRYTSHCIDRVAGFRTAGSTRNKYTRVVFLGETVRFRADSSTAAGDALVTVEISPTRSFHYTARREEGWPGSSRLLSRAFLISGELDSVGPCKHNPYGCAAWQARGTLFMNPNDLLATVLLDGEAGDDVLEYAPTISHKNPSVLLWDS